MWWWWGGGGDTEWSPKLFSICPCNLSSSDEDESAKLLIDRGAKVNPTNDKGATPLIIAAIKGHQSVLRILANHPQIKLHEQVCTTK